MWVLSLIPRVTSSNPRVTNSNPRAASSNPRVRRLKLRVGRLKAQIERLKARVRRLKAQFEAVNLRVKWKTCELKDKIPSWNIKFYALQKILTSFTFYSFDFLATAELKSLRRSNLRVPTFPPQDYFEKSPW